VSGLAGILRTDGRPVDRARLDLLAAPLAHRGPDGARPWSDGPVGLVQLLHRSTGREGDGAPRVDPTGQVCVTLDGRLDDRASLLAALGPARDRLRDDADVELVLAAYLHFGRAALARLVGDLALALWDGRSRELVLARDPLGQRPLCYHHGGGALRWASELAGVLADPDVPRRPNPAMVAEHLADAVTSTTETLWDGVLRVPPGHALVAGPRGVRLERFWAWEPAEPATTDDDEAVEQLRATFDAAVADRLVGPLPVGAELSGGLDSSSVLGTAVALRGTDRLEVGSLVFPGRPYDERAQIAAVAAHLGLTPRLVEPPTLDPGWYDAEILRTLELPPAPTLAMHHPLAEALRAQGAHALLTGRGGDEWWSGSPLVLADDLRHGRWRGLRQRARDDRPLWPQPRRQQLARHALVPLLPDRTQRAVARAAGRGRPAWEWIPAAFRAEVALDDRVRRPAPPGPDRAAAHVAGQLDDGGRLRADEAHERAFAAWCLEVRSPFHDRRMVALALDVPDRIRRRHGGPRWAVRVAMEGRVPDAVRLRADKAGFHHRLVEALEARGGRAAFEDLELERAGWIDGPAVRAAYDRLLAADRAGRPSHYLWPLWHVACANRWLLLSSAPGGGGRPGVT
jgi:asparagine synthase (glutamine-hydrolysing)